MDNKNRQQSIISSVLKRNDNSNRNPLDRTLEAYKIDKNDLDSSFRLTDFEDAITQKVAEQLHKYNLKQIKGNQDDSAFDNVFETDELTKFYKDELKELVGDVSGMSRSMLKNQLARMDSLMETLADSDSKEKDFMLEQYAQSVTFLEDEYKRKSNVMMRTQTFMGNLASEYLDVQSLYSGFVDHNPLAMGLFKLGKTALDSHREAKMERKQLVETDLHRQVQAQDTEQRKAEYLKQEEKRAQELYDANVKAGNINPKDNSNDNNTTSNSNKNSDEPVLRKNPIPASGVVESQISDKVSGSEAEGAKADQIRDENLKKKQYKFLKASANETSKWQKDVIKKLNKLNLMTAKGTRKGGRGLAVGAGAGAGGMLDKLGTMGKGVLGGIVGALGAGAVGAGGVATGATVGAGALVGTAIGTGISKGYEKMRGGKGSIGSDIYDLINDNATIKNLEKRGVIDRDWLGDSELDRSKLSELHADELKALLQLKDFDKADNQAIMKELKKKTDARIKSISKSNHLRRQREEEQILAMTPEQRIRNIGYDPVARDKSNSDYLRNKLANKDKPLNLNQDFTPERIDVNKALRQAGQRDKYFTEHRNLKSIRTGASDTKDQVYDALKMKGLPDHMVQAIMMNMQDESGFKHDITESVANVHGTYGKGLYQLTDKRRLAYEAKYGNDYSVNNQVDYMMHEFQTTEKRAYNQMMSAGSAGEAGKVMVEKFLRPAKEHQISRGNKYINSTGDFYTRSQQVKTVDNATIPVQNNGIEKVQHIEKASDAIEAKKNEPQPIVVSQQATTVNSSSSESSNDSPIVPSARNTDSSLQRITDRQISHSMV